MSPDEPVLAPRSAASATAVNRPPTREVVVPDLDSMVRWHQHSYPHPLARWHTHPEVEIHLIRAGTGLAFVGDHVGRFQAGHLVLVGAHVPHNWISDLAPGQVLEGRDVVLQVHPERLRELATIAPEAAEAMRLFASASRGLQYTGQTAREAAALLECVGVTSGLRRLQHLFGLLSTLSAAPEEDRRELASTAVIPAVDAAVQRRVDDALRYITENLTEEVRLTDVAELVGMTPSAFSRFFSRAAGRGFVDMIRRLRVIRACTLLTDSDLPVADICYEVGYANLSNFNRQFRAETGTTPREYRRATRSPGAT
jgi:AraC-like DNA-binding protein/mannose-6-phosphate isomerase-like protein (cupin superfamily)